MHLRSSLDNALKIFVQVDFKAITTTQVQLVRGIYAIGKGSKPLEYSFKLEIVLKGDHYQIEYMSEALYQEIADEIARYGIDFKNFSTSFVSMNDFYPSGLLVEAINYSKNLDWKALLIDPLKIPTQDEAFFKQPLPSEGKNLVYDIGNSLNLPNLWRENGFLRQRKPLIESFNDYRVWVIQLTDEQKHILRETLIAQLPDVATENEAQWYNIDFFRHIEQSLIDIFTSRIRYLGANRLVPTMIFASNTPMNWSEVGTKGENVASALREHGNKEIKFFHPELQNVHRGPLNNAVILWLQHFQLVERIETEDKGKLGTLLKIHTLGLDKELDLTSVGFGTSQILPIIVQGLLTPPGGIFIVEQPEVHLHPRVQSQLADFFLALIHANIQCIIETHSEHIINRLRRRIVEDESNKTVKRIQIYFVEKREAKSLFSKVEANEYGAIINWPAGFFDQVENENLYIAKTASKRRRSKG